MHNTLQIKSLFTVDIWLLADHLGVKGQTSCVLQVALHCLKQYKKKPLLLRLYLCNLLFTFSNFKHQ